MPLRIKEDHVEFRAIVTKNMPSRWQRFCTAVWWPITKYEEEINTAVYYACYAYIWLCVFVLSALAGLLAYMTVCLFLWVVFGVKFYS